MKLTKRQKKLLVAALDDAKNGWLVEADELDNWGEGANTTEDRTEVRNIYRVINELNEIRDLILSEE